MAIEKIVNWKIEDKNCRGILHLPTNNLYFYKVIQLLNPGLKYRVGPHRLNVKLSRFLAENGYAVLRLDPGGIGDSDGGLPIDTVANLWSRIEHGHFVQDILIANRLLLQQLQSDELCLIGLCGGAISAILAAAQDRRVKRIILIDVPVFFSTNIKNDADFVKSKDYANQIFSYYRKKLLKPRAWLRFFSFKSDYQVLLKTLFYKIKSTNHNDSLPSANYPKNFNFLFLEAFKKCMSQQKQVLFILSGNSHTTGEFIESFRKQNLFPGNLYETLCQIAVIKDANHTYTLLKWQEELFLIITNWLSLTNGEI